MSQPIHTKYTTRSTGIWEVIRKWLVLVPNRSSGNPLVHLYRNPPPGARTSAKTYKDPVTIPAGDIIQNTYHARDYRRNYPRISSVDQSKIAGLISLGSREAPRIAKGAEGEGQVAVFQNGGVSLAETLKNESQLVDKALGGQFVAPSLALNDARERRPYIIKQNESGMYDSSYPVRIFNFK